MKCETALPKNIRQIGEIQQNQRVYLEDYVMTFLRKKEKEADQEEGSCFAGILMGSGEWEEDGFCIFVKGALLMDTGGEEGAWERLEEEKKQSFPELEPVGCFVIGMLEEAQVQEMTGQFGGTSYLIYHVQEGEETVYLAKESEYERLKGYFIFYERNPGMQKYMTEHCQEQQVEKEEGNSDAAILSFRKKVKEKTAGKDNRGMRYLASSFLMLTVLVLGVTIIQNYDKIQEMEATISRISQEQERQQTVIGDQALAVSSSNVETAEETEAMSEADGMENGSQQTGAVSSLNESTGEAGSGESADGSAGDGVGANSQESGTGQEISGTAAAETVSQGTGGTTAAEAVSQETDGTAAAEASSQAILESWQEELLNQGDLDSADNTVSGETSRSAQGLAERNYSAEEALDASSSSGKTEESTGLTGRNGQSVYTVKYGDTLADISVKYYGTLDKVEEICELNQIDDANMIVPGEKIVLP